MGRAPCCEKSGLKKGPWTPEEDQKLVAYINKHGKSNWRALPKNAGLSRCGKSCRLRWTNYLRPDIKRGHFSIQEEHTIILLQGILGNKWSAISAWLPGRTDNEIKNYWNTTIRNRKRLLRMGIKPIAHTPRPDFIVDDLSTALLTPATTYGYPYPTQATADLDTVGAGDLKLEPLANNYEPDLLRLVSTLLLSGPPAAPVIGNDQHLPWFVQPQQQVVAAPPPQDEQYVAQHACQMPDLMQMVQDMNPTVQQHQQLAPAQQHQHEHQVDMMAAAAASCHSMQPPPTAGYVVDSLLDVPALMHMQMQMVQAADASNLQQWISSTVTSSSSNIVGSVINYGY